MGTRREGGDKEGGWGQGGRMGTRREDVSRREGGWQWQEETGWKDVGQQIRLEIEQLVVLLRNCPAVLCHFVVD